MTELDEIRQKHAEIEAGLGTVPEHMRHRGMMTTHAHRGRLLEIFDEAVGALRMLVEAFHEDADELGEVVERVVRERASTEEIKE